MVNFYCVTESKQVFTLSLTPTTNEEACQHYWRRGEMPPAQLINAALADPNGVHWPETVARARRAANGCGVYGTDPRLDRNAQIAA